MFNEESEVVLRCGQCNKPFDQPATLKRHGYYCRSRRRGPSVRVRSCTLCAKTKARCDNRKPACSRCNMKKVQCVYPTTSSENCHRSHEEGMIQHRPESPKGLATHTSVNSVSPPDSGGSSFDNASSGMTFEATDIDWDKLVFNLDDLEPLTTDQGTKLLPREMPFTIPNHTSFQFTNTLQAHSDALLLSPSMLVQPTSTPRSLIQRSNLENGPQRIVSLILHTVKSYPQMMMLQDALPPFIHPLLVSANSNDSHHEPVNDCISLLKMISHGVQSTRALFWRTVRAECERWQAEDSMTNKWDTLKALQALFIYIAFRLDEGETDYNNYDHLLVSTVIIISRRLAFNDMPYTASPEPTMSRAHSSWKKWLLEESGRRLCVVFQILNLALHFEPAAICDVHNVGLLLAPLPANRQYWEAKDEFAWQAATGRPPGVQVSFGLTTSGDMVRLNKNDACRNNSGIAVEPLPVDFEKHSARNWQEWCSGMDALGGLVMLASSLTANNADPVFAGF